MASSITTTPAAGVPPRREVSSSLTSPTIWSPTAAGIGLRLGGVGVAHVHVEQHRLGPRRRGDPGAQVTRTDGRLQLVDGTLCDLFAGRQAGVGERAVHGELAVLVGLADRCAVLRGNEHRHRRLVVRGEHVRQVLIDELERGRKSEPDADERQTHDHSPPPTENAEVVPYIHYCPSQDAYSKSGRYRLPCTWSEHRWPAPT